MAWIARSRDGHLNLFRERPISNRCGDWFCDVFFEGKHYSSFGVCIPDKTDELLIARHITWEDEPVEI